MLFTIFDSFFLLRPTAKLFAFYCACANLHYRFRNWFLYKMFSIWLCSFQSTFSSRFYPIPENDTGSRRRTVIRPLCVSLRGFLGSSPFTVSRLPTSSISLALVSTWNEQSDFSSRSLPRKEVIQPHLPIRLPCYDFTPVIGLTFDGWLLSVTSPASGAPNSHGVTGGVYKARERIHRGMLIRDY